MNLLRGILLIAAIVCAAVAAPTQTGQVTPEQRKAANDLYAAQNWAKAAESYEAIAKLEPQNAGALYRLGRSLHGLGHYKRAAEAYEQSEKLSRNPVVLYNLACVYSMLSENGKAVVWLEKAVSAGFSNIGNLESDAEMKNLLGSEEFIKSKDKLYRAASPCEYDPRSRQFDFWIGDWEVKTPQGQKAGDNLIQRVEKGCLMVENWTDVFGGSGKSVNFFDRSLNKWRQTWIDDKGNITEYAGEFKDGAMRFEGETHKQDGGKTVVRMTFTELEKGRVRQFGESSTDNGKTWAISFDLIYTLKNSAGSK